MLHTCLPGAFNGINYLNNRLQNVFYKFDFKFMAAEQEAILRS